MRTIYSSTVGPTVVLVAISSILWNSGAAPALFLEASLAGILWPWSLSVLDSAWIPASKYAPEKASLVLVVLEKEAQAEAIYLTSSGWNAFRRPFLIHSTDNCVSLRPSCRSGTSTEGRSILYWVCHEFLRKRISFSKLKLADHPLLLENSRTPFPGCFQSKV